MGNSLKVERLILDQVVGVRIPVPQPTLQSPRLWQSRAFSLGLTAKLTAKVLNSPVDLHPLVSTFHPSRAISRSALPGIRVRLPGVWKEKVVWIRLHFVILFDGDDYFSSGSSCFKIPDGFRNLT